MTSVLEEARNRFGASLTALSTYPPSSRYHFPVQEDRHGRITTGNEANPRHKVTYVHTGPCFVNCGSPSHVLCCHTRAARTSTLHGDGHQLMHTGSGARKANVLMVRPTYRLLIPCPASRHTRSMCMGVNRISYTPVPIAFTDTSGRHGTSRHHVILWPRLVLEDVTIHNGAIRYVNIMRPCTMCDARGG